MKKEFVLQLVENSASSIFSREDVIKLINSVEGGGRVITTNDIESVEFELAYNNKIEVTSVPLQLENLREALENNFMDFGEAIEEDSNDEERDDE